ncbi:DUF6933 domain-containing protein [Promicromonospora umidemergens]|uniref:DUF6933 domain-containing protein n=1 Tax=Promicromonospora umidemergens TaxID=629679 RepID=UPI0035579502
MGDWYVNATPWQPQVAILVNERTLVPVLIPLAPAASMSKRAPGAIEEVLTAHGMPEGLLAAELDHMREVRIAQTVDRSVVGSMNDFIYLADVWRSRDLSLSLLDLSLRLAHVPCSPLSKRQVFPDAEFAALIANTRSG